MNAKKSPPTLSEVELESIFSHGHILGDPLCEICHIWKNVKAWHNKTTISLLKELLAKKYQHTDNSSVIGETVEVIPAHELEAAITKLEKEGE